MTKNHQIAAARPRTSSGKRKTPQRDRCSDDGRSSSRHEQPEVEAAEERRSSCVFGSHPNQSRIAPTKMTNAATALIAKSPPVTRWPRSRAASAAPARTTKRSSRPEDEAAGAVLVRLRSRGGARIGDEDREPAQVDEEGSARPRHADRSHAATVTRGPDGPRLPAASFEQLFWRERRRWRGRSSRRRGPARRARAPAASWKCVVASTIAFARSDGFVRLEDARADEDAVRAELHAERRVGRSRDPAGRERHDRQLPVLGDPLHELDRRAQLLRLGVELVRSSSRRAS